MRAQRIGTAVLLTAASVVAAGATPTPNFQWNWANPKPSGDLFNAVAYGNGVYVAAGEDGVIYSSTDTKKWTPQDGGPGIGSNYLDALYANGLFLLGGVDGSGASHITTSRDSVSWSDQMLGLPVGESAYNLGYGNGTYVALGNVAAVSQDGLHWQTHSIAAAGDSFGAPAYANGVFATLGNGTNDQFVYYSTDAGATWQQSPFSVPAGAKLTSLAGNGSLFILTGVDGNGACAHSCGLVYTSTDGKDWIRQTDAGADFGFTYPLFWNRSRFVTPAIGILTQGIDLLDQWSVYSTADGINWTQGATATAGLFVEGSQHPITAGAQGTYLATSATPLGLQSSSDLVSWSTVLNGASGPAPKLNTVSFVNGKYFTAGESIGGSFPFSILESDDGLNWSTVYQQAGATDNYDPNLVTDFAYGNGIYVAVGQGGVFFSNDGKNWQAANPALGVDALSTVAYGNGEFVAVGGDCNNGCFPSVATSPDGKTWTAHDISSVAAVSLAGVAFTGTRFVALGNGYSGQGSAHTASTIMASNDGINWTVAAASPLPLGGSFSRLQQSQGRLVASGMAFFGGTPYVLTSQDGLKWQGGAVNLGGQQGLYDATYDGNYYYALPFNGELFWSQDATHWSQLSGAPYAILSNLTYGEGRLVATGYTGNIVEADSGNASSTGGGGAPGLPVLGVLLGLVAMRWAKAVSLCEHSSHRPE